MENASFPSRSHGCCKILRIGKKNTGRQEKTSTTKWRKTATAVSNHLCPLQKLPGDEGGECAFVGVCACVYLMFECGGANGVLIAWQ